MDEKDDYPEQDEFVLATVKKIMPYGAFCNLDEYPAHDGFLHISQVSSGWIRNIREHLREGQKLVVKISGIDKSKHQIDLSLKQVSESDKKRKMEAYKAERKARKLIEVASAKTGLTPAQVRETIMMPLLAENGSAATALEALHEGTLKTKLPKNIAAALSELVTKEFTPKRVAIRAELMLASYDSNGVEEIRQTLQQIETKFSDKDTTAQVIYLGAPNYYLDLESNDYKTAEKQIDKIQKYLATTLKQAKCEYALERKK